jgi:phosphatidylserine/phosphatidylglycerophosphate/cardiolipin synthase-like enzyme
MRDTQMFSTTANIQVLDSWETWATIQLELKHARSVFGWLYLTTQEWLDKFISTAERPIIISFIVDDRMTKAMERACERNPNLTAYGWAKNRTMHDKTLVFPNTGVTIIQTTNMTKGSYLLAQNRAVRIDSAALAAHLMNEWDYYRSRARLIRPRKTRESPHT